MLLRLIVAACLLALFSPVWASEAPMNNAILYPSGHVEYRNSLDDPQPDTLRFDDNTPALLNTATNFWTRVRFNAPNNFELRSIYFYSTNGDGGAEPCTVRVYDANGASFGTLRSTHVMAGSVLNFGWNDTNLPQPVQFSAGDSFYVAIGRVPGGQQTAGWHVIMDNANTGRSGYSNNGIAGTWHHPATPPDPLAPGGDYMLRAGGAVDAFVDLEASECFNSVAGSPSFNFLPGNTVGLNASITNIGNTAVPLYTVHWEVMGPSGNLVYDNEVAAGPIADGQIQSVSSETTFDATAAGEYLATCTVDADGDAAGDNNTTYLRFFAGGIDRWYRYDDGASDGNYIGFTTGNGWGVSFTPSLYTAQIETVRVDVGGAGNGDFRIYLNDDDTDLPAGEPLWSSTPTVVAGWNTIAVTPPVAIFQGQTFTLAYLYSGVGLGKDDTPPNDAGISNMGTIAFQASSDGTLWEADNSGNWSMQVYLDSSNLVPPFPIIDTNLDTMQFGQVDTAAAGVPMTLWIYNLGGLDPLNVTNMVINPPAVRNAYSLSRTSLTVAAGDSEDVVVTFNPPGVATYNGIVAITNNSDNAPSKNIRILGQGIHSVAVDDPQESLPTQYSLSQNYPNPFNPSTEISFALPQMSNVKLTVYNTLGQEVSVLAEGQFSAGYHSVTFDATQLPAGLYFYRMEAGDFSAIHKMMLLK